MKTAILLSGHMRSFARCLPNQFDHIYRHFPDADFYVSTVRDEDSSTAELLRARFPKSRVEIEVLDCQPEIPIPVPPVVADWQAGQNRLYSHEPYAISVHPQAVLRQLWHLNRCWEFFTNHQPAWATHYGRFIRIRPDLYFRSAHDVANAVTDGVARTPWWGRFGGINDRFAIMGHKAAEAYFTTFARLPALLEAGYPLHPERLIYGSLQESHCYIADTLRVEFAKLIWDRSTHHGSFRDPEISQIDMAHLSAA